MPASKDPSLYLRAPVSGDRQAFLLRVSQSRKLHHRLVQPPADSKSFSTYLARCSQVDFSGRLLCRREDDAIVGAFNISQMVRGAFHSAYLGYYAFTPFSGQGYMRVGMGLLLRHAFTELRLHRIEANLQPENVASRALVKRYGFALEGYSPRYLKIAGRWRDHERWALLSENWRRAR
jgi:ribosomal-protein-alanine N-acetyltransferase